MQGESYRDEMTISRFGKWIVASAAGIGAVIGAAKSLRDVIEHLNGWHVLLTLSLVVLIALGIDWYREWLAKQFAEVEVKLQAEATARGSALASMTQHSRSVIQSLQLTIDELKPTPQTDYDLTASLRDELQRFIDELGEEPRPNYKGGHAEFDNRLELVGRFERRLRYGFQLRFAPRIQTLGYKLAEKSINEGLLQIAAQQPKNLAALNTIRDQLSDLASALRPKS